MQRFLALVMFAAASLLSCTSKVEVKAFVFERKKVGAEQVLVKYRYSYGGQQYVDSTVIRASRPANADTITVIFNEGRPDRSIPDFSFDYRR